MTTLDLINEERDRQAAKGFDAGHDDQHADGSIAIAAGLIALEDPDLEVNDDWEEKLSEHVCMKYADDRIKQLVIASALLVAEIERLQRMARIRSSR